MTPEEIAELTVNYEDPIYSNSAVIDDINPAVFVDPASLLPLATTGGLNQISGSLSNGSDVEETKYQP